MTTIVKFVFLAITLITALPGTELLSNYLLQKVFNFLSPQDHGIMRVRNLQRAKTLNNMEILNFIGLSKMQGYPAEEHDVVTEDGYKLKIHRIPDSPLSSNKRNKKVVFLQHGILATSDAWILMGPDKDLAFLLADQGYDVWLGNIRGNAYCRSHIKMSPQDVDFWRFSYHEVGEKDLPAMIDYALNHTGQEGLLYIGHSMGTTALFVLLSTRPEYNLKIKLGVCLAPVAFWKKISPVMKNVIDVTPQIIEFLNTNRINELFPLTANFITTTKVFCADKTITQPICMAIIFLIAGSDPAQFNITTLPELLTYFPAGTSLRTLHHFYQNIVTGDFRSYDEGLLEGYDQFQQGTKYNLENVVAPLAFFYGANDLLAPRKNVFETYKQLSNVIVMEEVPYRFFNHLDFLWAINGKSLLYDRVMDMMRRFEDKIESSPVLNDL